MRADQVGFGVDALPADLAAHPDVLEVLEELRSKVAARLGLCASWRDAYRRYRTWPKIAVVAAPAAFQTLQGAAVSAEAIHVQGRVISMGRPHKAMAITAAIPMAAATRIPGSVVQEVCRPPNGPDVNIGHPSGILSLQVRIEQERGTMVLRDVVVGRTARRLMDGHVYCRIAP